MRFGHRAHVAPARTDHLRHAQLLQAVRQQPDAARRREQAEGRIGRQSMVRDQGGQGDVDVGLQARSASVTFSMKRAITLGGSNKASNAAARGSPSG